jgi:hypothetical protein
LVQASFRNRVVRVDTSRRLVSWVPQTGVDIFLFVAFAATAAGLVVSGHASGMGAAGVVAYGALALLWGLSLLPDNQRAVTIDLLDRRVILEGAYGNGRGTETRFDDLTFDVEEGFTRRKRGRMAPWIVLRAVVDAGTPEARTLFATDASDAPAAIAAIRELSRVMNAACRDAVASRELALTVLEARVAAARTGIAGPCVVGALLLPGVLACLGSLR